MTEPATTENQLDVIEVMNERQQIAYNELSDMALSRGMPEASLKATLSDLEKRKLIASRSSGGILMYYTLQQQDTLRKVLIVEDDKNINKLMALSIGKGFEVSQIYDGGEAISFVRGKKPDLVILDLMLPHKDGLDICQTIKSDPGLTNTVVILVSAMDPTSNRFKGIKYGADYYIKKPFDPNELKSLVTIFLKKKGKRFDPLIDLPDEERISKQVEDSISQGGRYVLGTLKVSNLGLYARQFGEKSAVVILRLISQLLQDITRNSHQGLFVGFLTSNVFVVGGPKATVEAAVKEAQQEFGAVLPFILQDADASFRTINLDLESLFETNEVPRLSLAYTEMEKEKVRERREQILRSKGASKASIGAYTYDELSKLLGGDAPIDVKITRDDSGIRLQVSKGSDKGEE